MGISLCTSTQIDITKWYILPELFPKSKDKSSAGRAMRIRQVSYHKGHIGHKELMRIPLSFVFFVIFVVVYFGMWMRLQRTADNGPLTTDELSELLGVSRRFYAGHAALSHSFSKLPG